MKKRRWETSRRGQVSRNWVIYNVTLTRLLPTLYLVRVWCLGAHPINIHYTRLFVRCHLFLQKAIIPQRHHEDWSDTRAAAKPRARLHGDATSRIGKQGTSGVNIRRASPRLDQVKLGTWSPVLHLLQFQNILAVCGNRRLDYLHEQGNGIREQPPHNSVPRSP